MNDPNLKLLEAAVELLNTAPGHRSARVITSTYFPATKLAAFSGRGHDDYSGSHDLEDVITVMDGRPEIVNEVRNASRDVRGYIACEIRRLLEVRPIVDALTGFLLPDAASQARYPILRERLDLLAQSDA